MTFVKILFVLNKNFIILFLTHMHTTHIDAMSGISAKTVVFIAQNLF